MILIRRLPFDIAPQIFTARCVYNGRKKIFSIHKLKFNTGSQEFDVTLADESPSAPGKGPKVYKIKLTLVAEFNPEVLHRFIEGKASHDNTALTTITYATQLVVSVHVRSFTDRETENIGVRLELWRGYFQPVHPGIGKMLINVGISTGTMCKRFGFCFIVVFVDLANLPLVPASAPLPRVHQEEQSEHFISYPWFP
ncbi:hypothetical protein K438DRAFT_370653 [Mycena galopus ATCC 62051]|nr:hypothetical protein K438DRAFT_370653 [Mycena galopus ATCC 62051]